MTTFTAELIDQLVPRPALDVDELEAKYPARDLPKNAEVTRVGPSPTGFVHIGTLYAALIAERLAHQTGGVFYLRLEDTDQKRELIGARELIIDALDGFNLPRDEGPLVKGDAGKYGPYEQSHRREIYHAYIRKMLQIGRAYPCFATPEELAQNAQTQKDQKVRPGYYGKWATWRDKSEAEIVAALDAGLEFVIRFKSHGDVGRRIALDDVVKGHKELPENDNDVVIMKREGLPTYHFAHVVDDHLMHTTTVVRGDEWLPSVTLHIQLAAALGIAPFKYAHIPLIQKMDGKSRRKLSKRKDPEANVAFFLQRGFPVDGVMEYMFNLANSSFEEWRRTNPTKPYAEFPFDIHKLPKNSGALFDLQKMEDISQDALGRLSPEQLYDAACKWAETYDADHLYDCMARDREYGIKVFGVERGSGKRKDMAVLSDVRDAYGYFFDCVYAKIQPPQFLEGFGAVQKDDIAAIVSSFLQTYNPADSQEEWFDKLKKVGEPLGFTPDTREYRKNPDQFKGSVAEVAMVLRVILTGRNRSPNLHEVMQIMGEERVRERFRMRGA